MVRTKIVILILFLLSFRGFAQVKTGAEQTGEYLPLLINKKVALVANHTSLVNGEHLLDVLLKNEVDVIRIFAPEHGFRGDHSAGATVESGKDVKTGLPIISLYGSHKKPTAKDLQGVDVMIFDIQDVGCRFYTYISTLHYIMEAGAENDVHVIVLDRPNPNGYFVDGPVLEQEYQSFVGMHPVPVVYGMTIGEYAQMINGENWLPDNAKCPLTVVKLKNYDHNTLYKLPVKPSPNLPTPESIYLYPSLCFFEGTDVSVGRGTEWPFEVIGKPGFEPGNFTFTPKSIPGVAEHPPYKGETCKGFKLTKFSNEFVISSEKIYLQWLIGFYKHSENKEKFFNSFFDKLAGTDKLRIQIKEGWTEEKIRTSWKEDLQQFKKTRKKYLLYRDFEG